MTEQRSSRWAAARRTLRDSVDFSSLRRSEGAPYGSVPFLVIVTISFFQAFDTAAYESARPEIAQDLHLSLTAVGGITSIVGTFGIFITIAVARYADRHARVPLVALGTLGSGVFSLLSAGSTSALTIGASRTLDDLADTASITPFISLMPDYYSFDRMGRVFGLSSAVRRIAALCAPLAAGYLVSRAIGWRLTLVVFGVPLVVLGAVALVLLKEPVRGYHERRALGANKDEASEEQEAMSFGESWRVIWSVRTVRRLFIASIWSGAGVGMILLVMPFLLADVFQLDAFQRGLLIIPSALGGIAGGLVGGSLIDRYMRENPTLALYVLVGFTVIGGIGQLVLFVSTGNLVMLVAGQTVLAFGATLTGLAVAAVYVQVMPPNVRTTGISVLGLSQLPLTLIATPLAFAVADAYGYRATILLALPLQIVGGAVLMSVAGYFETDRRNAWKAAAANLQWKQERDEGRAKLLTCRNVDVSYEGVQVLFDVSLELDVGETVALLGTNGAGKSTLMRAIAGIQQADAGVIAFDGRDITHMPPHEIFGRGIVTVAGGRGIFPGLTVRDNLRMALWKVADDGASADSESVEPDERLREVFSTFPVLRDRIDEHAGDLSGGEQQMLILAQALLVQPRLIMIDELSMGLAPAVVGELLDVVREINRRGAAVLLVEQSINVAAAVADRAVFMEKGEVRFDGPTSQLFDRPDVVRAIHLHGTAALRGGSTVSRAGSPRASAAGTPDGSRPALEVIGAVKRYGGVVALDGVDLTVSDGYVVALIGPNGSGKTTLFDVVSGTASLDAGTVRHNGDDITALAPHERARRGVIRRFQDARLFPSLTVYENLLIALDKGQESKTVALSALGLPAARRSERRARLEAARLIDLLDLGDYRDKFVKELSTGLRRITDLAIVLAAAPKLLLLDEPSTGIAQAEVENLAPLLRRARYETGCSILIIEHDMPLVSAVADEVVALVSGQVAARGSAEDVLNDERVIEAYLGASEVAVERSGRRRT